MSSIHDWKRTRCLDFGALVEEHLKTKAFLIAEKDGFKKTAEEYWNEAKKLHPTKNGDDFSSTTLN